MKHTEGPWFWNPYRATITQQNPNLAPDPTKEMVALVHTSHGVEPSEEDLKLILAAPELLSALKRLLACPDLDYSSLKHETMMAMEDARLAINKADGTICPD